MLLWKAKKNGILSLHDQPVRMKKILLLLFLFFPMSVFAQNNDELYTRDWERADSLIERGLLQSAAKIAERIYATAKQKGQQVQMMKAQIYLLNTGFQRSEEAFENSIHLADSLSENSSFPSDAIWKSISAQLYWAYYQQNRWKILNRTTVDEQKELHDFEQWDAARFFNAISGRYLASISDDRLTKISIHTYDPLLIKGVHTEKLRPTLYDLLVFRALEYFANEEKDITQPAFHFVMDDETGFAPAKQFMQHVFESRDNTSLQWRALKLYQRILAAHYSDKDQGAFIDADIQRLEFAYRVSVLSDKKALYKQALEKIAATYSDNALAALAKVKAIQADLEPGYQVYNKRRPSTSDSKQEYDYPHIKQQLEQVVAQYPGSEGEALSRQLLQQITVKELNLTPEEVVLPEEPSKVLIQYRNTPHIWLRLIRLDKDLGETVILGDYYTDQSKILSLAPIQQWDMQLPSTEDYDRHSAEQMMPPLPAGIYGVLISDKASFAQEQSIVSASFFQVSSISVVQDGQRGFVLNRKTGMPIQSARIRFVQPNGRRGGSSANVYTTQSAADGSFAYTQQIGSEAMRVVSGKDSLFIRGYFYNNHAPEKRTEQKTFFFTDRSIYRPGQTVFFKGIVVNGRQNGRDNEIVPNHKTTVTFYDANGSKIAGKEFITNEYGSFNGSFIAPQGLLTGNMRLENENGSVYFSVEEYKRPKFAVHFDTLKADYALNDTVHIQGKAEAFAGNMIDGATVRYRVVRNVRYPYWWYAYRWGGPQSPEMEIVQGSTVTDKHGAFHIEFKAIPDVTIASESMPVFSYTITADITDINGETRTNSTTVSVGYTSLQINAAIPGKADPQELDTLHISTANLNGTFVAASLEITISRLQSPGRVLRKRLWEMPDQFLVDADTFKKYFPNDVYKDEDDPMQWSVAAQVWKKTLRSTKDGNIAIPSGTWGANGQYVVEITTTDKNGKQLTEKKYVQVWSPRQSGSMGNALIAVPATQTAAPGNTATINVASDYSQLHLIQGTYTADHETAVHPIQYEGKPIAYTRKITESDRGGVIIDFITVKENRVYTEHTTINVPWSNKDLDISWETHRDKLLPGESETWTMVIRGDKKEKVGAEMVASLYDASLDVFRNHQWTIPGLYPSVYRYGQLSGLGFGTRYGINIYYSQQFESYSYEKTYDQFCLAVSSSPAYPHVMYDRAAPATAMASLAGGTYQQKNGERISIGGARKSKELYIVDGLETAQNADNQDESKEDETTNRDIQSIIQPRKNLQETAFFFPDLHTDAEGNIRLNFTMPEALTEWKLLTFAHTKDMRYGFMEGHIRTQKELMVAPALPRFFRQGDKITITAKISNLGDQNMNGAAKLELLNAQTMQPLNLPFRLEQQEVTFNAAKGQSTAASWEISVPESLYEPVTVRITARAGNFTDGEDNTLPVVTNRMLVTETMPLWMNGNGNKTFHFDKLVHSDSAATLAQHALTVEYSANPAWYAVQSLPYLMEYPYECAEQTFNRYYATALAAHIIAQSPKVKAIFDRWKTESALSSFSSPLEKNEALKSALLEETPWVMEAKTETERRTRLGELFDTYKLSRELDAAARKLKNMQLASGAFGWFSGMYADRYITQYIVTGIGKLRQLGVTDNNGFMQTIVHNALPYLDGEIKKSYDELLRLKAKMGDQHVGYYEVQYLYMRSFFPKETQPYTEAYNYYKQQAATFWPKFNAYSKGMIALMQYRTNNKTVANNILQSLRETAVYKEELGMYWPAQQYSYWWYDAPVETQSLLISCFDEIAHGDTSINDMRRWLLKNKQTNSWNTTKATADACYALLLTGPDWINTNPDVTISMGSKKISSSDVKQEAGTGYFKTYIKGDDIQPEMGNITLRVTDAPSKSPTWGAIYWQYFEQMDKISGSENNLQVTKELFVENNTDRGPVLKPVKNQQLKIGDKLKVRIVVKTDRDMEYVHLKDMRASCFEPLNVLSGYKWQGGTGYYESTKDLSTNFFFDHLRKGTYVFEYPVYIVQKGQFSAGVTSIQCMYAPEYASHSEGQQVIVE